MDLFLVAAAAGAGYLAKYWQNILRDQEGSSGFPSRSAFHDDLESSSLIQQIRDKTCPVSKLSPLETSEQYFTETGNGNHSERMFAERSRDGDHEDENMPSSSTFPPEYRKYETIEEYGSEMGASHGSRRSKNVMRTKRLHLQFIKPRSSLDSCLMAQMHKEHAEVEEYLRSPLVSPYTPTLRPFLVTDGKRVISRASADFRDGPHKEVLQKAHDAVVGLPALQQIWAANHSKEKLHKVKSQMGKSSNTGTSMHFDSLGGSSSGQVLFCLGISLGIMSTVIANKLEVRKLEDNLKQSENLVQDLQEELEMKDSLTVKELYDEDSQDAHENLCGDKKLNMFSSQVNTNMVVKCADDESVTLKEVESMSKIEAELEVELERLELSMKGSTLKGRLSDAVEFDEDITAELVHGELKADIIQRRSSSEPTPDEVSSTTSTPLSVKHGVSPRELSVRLHEVIQSRLQERVIELEAELAKSQKRVRDLESERINSWREVSYSESSSTLGSPIAHSPMARPLIMNLSGDALDAYNEAYDELNKLKGSPNETCLSNTGEEPLPNGRKKMSSNEGTPNIYEDKDDDDDDDDDDDLLLIKQIVEKARQGSPAILRAQKAMVYLNKNDHW